MSIGEGGDCDQVGVFKNFNQLLSEIDPRWFQRKDTVFGEFALSDSSDWADSRRAEKLFTAGRKELYFLIFLKSITEDAS